MPTTKQIFQYYMILAFSIILLSGCSNCRTYKQFEKCTNYTFEDTNNSCLSEIQIYLPTNYSGGELDVSFSAYELCYDVIEDADNIREKVDKVIKEHPNDWENYIDWIPQKKDPIVNIFEDPNLSEPKRINKYNGTKIERKCTKTELIWRCIDDCN